MEEKCLFTQGKLTEWLMETDKEIFGRYSKDKGKKLGFLRMVSWGWFHFFNSSMRTHKSSERDKGAEQSHYRKVIQ